MCARIRQRDCHIRQCEGEISTGSPVPRVILVSVAPTARV
jgi:hypothetical protein